MNRSITVKKGTILEKITTAGNVRVTIEKNCKAVQDCEAVIRIGRECYLPVFLTLVEAALVTKTTKKRVLNAIKSGRITAIRDSNDETGITSIVSSLHIMSAVERIAA